MFQSCCHLAPFLLQLKWMESFLNTWEKVFCVFPIDSRNCLGQKISEILVSNCDLFSGELEHPPEITWNLLFLDLFPKYFQRPRPNTKRGNSVVPPSYKWLLPPVASPPFFLVSFLLLFPSEVSKAASVPSTMDLFLPPLPEN